jgi:hypothetical protein
MLARLALAALFSLTCLGASLAAPSRIIILRHGEKDDAWRLCGVGEERAHALAAFYLGRDAGQSLFGQGEAPAAFLAITLHSLELAAPAAASWDEPLTLYAVVPDASSPKDKNAAELALNRRSQEAAHDLMTNPAWQGKTVVMAWEHKHIASAKLAAAFPGEAVTLRQLLQLDKLNGVPETWPSGTYDYFWIVGYDAGSGAPASFSMVKQNFGAPYDDLPANDWGAPNGLQHGSGCDLKGASE